MTAKKDDAADDRKWILALVVAILGAGGGSAGGTWFYLNKAGAEEIQSLVRPDPFTGSQGATISRKVDALTQEVRRLERRVDQLPPRELEQGLALLTQEVKHLSDTIGQHLSDDH